MTPLKSADLDPADAMDEPARRYDYCRGFRAVFDYQLNGYGWSAEHFGAEVSETK